MNYLRLILAAAGGFVTYFILGGLSFAVAPQLRDEFARYPAIYRSQDAMMTVIPFGMAAMFVAMVALAAIFARSRSGAGMWEGTRFGVLVGIFAFGAFVVHNYVNLNIGPRLTLEQSVAYFVEWALTGTVIALIYRPRGPATQVKVRHA